MHRRGRASLVAAPLVALAGLLAAGCTAQQATPPAGAPGAPQPSAAPGAAGRPAVESLTAQGKSVFASVGCSGCHRAEGVGATTGPDLSHVGAARSPEWLAEQMRDPRKHKPNGMMPPMGADRVSDSQLKALVAYLSGLK